MSEWWLRSKLGKGVTWYASTKPYAAEYKPVRVVEYSALEAERERSEKLIEALKNIESMMTNADFGMTYAATDAIAEYEASREG